MVYLYKNETIYETEEKQITTATWGIPEWPGLLHFFLDATGIRVQGLSYSSSHFRGSFTMWNSCKTPLFSIGFELFFLIFDWNYDNLNNDENTQWSSELLV